MSSNCTRLACKRSNITPSMCGGCRVEIGETIKFACVDGQDFDDLIARLGRCRPTEKAALSIFQDSCRPRSYIATDEQPATSIAGVCTSGDIVTGAATVIQAMGAGRKATHSTKAHFGLRGSGVVYRSELTDPADRLIGCSAVRHRSQRAQFRPLAHDMR